MADMINEPPHYTSHPARCACGRGVECIQITEHVNFCLGNALKYIWRAGLKGDAVEDLEKARWYLDREIARRRPSHGHVNGRVSASVASVASAPSSTASADPAPAPRRS